VKVNCLIERSQLHYFVVNCFSFLSVCFVFVTSSVSIFSLLLYRVELIRGDDADGNAVLRRFHINTVSIPCCLCSFVLEFCDIPSSNVDVEN